MNAKDKGRILCVGAYICSRIGKIQSESNDPWYKLEERQAFMDVLLCLQHYNLIKDYNIPTGVTL